ncbi:hypothetical protein GN956_G5880 [Arapaima gigas]
MQYNVTQKGLKVTRSLVCTAIVSLGGALCAAREFLSPCVVQIERSPLAVSPEDPPSTGLRRCGLPSQATGGESRRRSVSVQHVTVTRNNQWRRSILFEGDLDCGSVPVDALDLSRGLKTRRFYTSVHAGSEWKLRGRDVRRKKTAGHRLEVGHTEAGR